MPLQRCDSLKKKPSSLQKKQLNKETAHRMGEKSSPECQRNVFSKLRRAVAVELPHARVLFFLSFSFWLLARPWARCCPHSSYSHSHVPCLPCVCFFAIWLASMLAWLKWRSLSLSLLSPTPSSLQLVRFTACWPRYFFFNSKKKNSSKNSH